MKKFFILFLIFISCARVYKKEINFYDFKKILLNKYGNKEIKEFYMEGDFESYGKTYMKGFFKVKFFNDTFNIKVFSPPFFIREIEDEFFKEVLKGFFNPLIFFEKYSVLGVREDKKYYIVEFKNFLIFFKKDDLFIKNILFEGGNIKLFDFKESIPRILEITFFDEKVRLKLKEFSYEFK